MTAVEAFGIAFNKNCSGEVQKYRSAYDAVMDLISAAAKSGDYSCDVYEIHISWAHPLGHHGRTFLPVSVV